MNYRGAKRLENRKTNDLLPWLKPGVSFQCRIKNAQHAFQNGDGFEKSGSIHPRTRADATVDRGVSRWALVLWFSGYLKNRCIRSGFFISTPYNLIPSS